MNIQECCTKCGKKLLPNDKFCTNCGVVTGNFFTEKSDDDHKRPLLISLKNKLIVSLFFFPVIIIMMGILAVAPLITFLWGKSGAPGDSILFIICTISICEYWLYGSYKKQKNMIIQNFCIKCGTKLPPNGSCIYCTLDDVSLTKKNNEDNKNTISLKKRLKRINVLFPLVFFIILNIVPLAIIPLIESLWRGRHRGILYELYLLFLIIFLYYWNRARKKSKHEIKINIINQINQKKV
jgi:ribosomal protein L32/uncharacterized RDD family membrane protein YckC